MLPATEINEFAQVNGQVVMMKWLKDVPWAPDPGLSTITRVILHAVVPLSCGPLGTKSPVRSTIRILAGIIEGSICLSF